MKRGMKKQEQRTANRKALHITHWFSGHSKQKIRNRKQEINYRRYRLRQDFLKLGKEELLQE